MPYAQIQVCCSHTPCSFIHWPFTHIASELEDLRTQSYRWKHGGPDRCRHRSRCGPREPHPLPPIHFSRAGGGVFNPGPQLLFEVGNN